MGLCFAVDLLVPKGRDGRSRIEVLHEERWRFVSKLGISPLDWGRMTKWQRQDLWLRHQRDLQARLKPVAAAKGGKAVAAIVQAVISKLLGV